jgi:uncharacterized membrane protein YphA (DoxX/SURF4 family)
MIAYLSKLAMLLFALVGAALWSAIDTAPKRHDNLLDLFQLFIRVVLAQILVTFGCMKLWHIQFGPPTDARLAETYADSSPMGLMWTFIGASSPYEMFAGALEVVAAMLLLFRRTRLLGALVTACFATK